jgi:long-chain-fatty-acid--[acyl-carrier-protein] ligase
LIRSLLSLRYRITIKGKETLNQKSLSKSGGILFLANHPAEIDPLILISFFWFPYRPHPIAIEYLFYKPFLHFFLQLTKALPVPSFDFSSNSYKKKKIEKTYLQISNYLKNKENVLVYPAGMLKRGPLEIIGGASGVHTILHSTPEANVVLIRSTGLWGSTFSRAPTGKTPELFQAFLNGFKILLKNGFFFTPRRHVQIELATAPQDFPWGAGRRELNKYLEKWYNAPGPEPLNLVSYSFYKKVYPSIKENTSHESISLSSVDEETKRQVIEEIAKLSEVPIQDITLESNLAQDLGFDSLDIAQLIIVLKDQFGVTAANIADLTTVGSVVAYAAKLTTGKEKKEEKEEEEIEMSPWKKEKNRPQAFYPEGETIPEIFLTTCARMDSHMACVDLIAGEMSYRRLKTGILLLAEKIRKMPGNRIGIMMPASVAVNALILAVIFAGKVPVMINWTLGGRNLSSVVKQSKIETTLSSWKFIDRLDNVELNGIDETIINIEDLRKQFTLKEKIRAFYLSCYPAKKLLKTLGLNHINPDDPAAILFTSGTENYPKGVPLSHKNILSNQKAAYALAKVKSDDILLGALPPFHSFGFSVTGLFPLLTGLRVAYSPNPTDGRRMAEAIQRWDITLLCLAPTFLKNLLRVSSAKHLSSLRMVVCGAERTASELYEKLRELNPKASLLEGYGITECAPILTLNPPDAPSQGVGTALPDVEIKVVNPDTLANIPSGEQGLILARGPNIFKGYLDPSFPSPFVEVDGKKWYYTGDLGYIDERHYLTLSGRLKRFVKIGGEMVSLAAIEETLYQAGPSKGWKFDSDSPSIAVCALENEGKKSEIHLFVIFDTTTEEVNQVLRESGMSNIIKIRSVKKIAAIPLLGTGKTDYRKLASLLSHTVE